jgi:hypothetical protein
MTRLTWADIEHITQGQLGRNIISTCPFCSSSRKRHNQKKKIFAVKLVDPDFAIFHCAHCGEGGYVHPERTAQVIDLAERQKRREDAERRERAYNQQRTA